MRTSYILLALPALVTAQQIPFLDELKGWFAKATESLSSAIPPTHSSVSAPDLVAAGAAKVADLRVEHITLQNFEEVLKTSIATDNPGLEKWMIFVTGGNKTCYGTCGHAEEAWNESVPLIAASTKQPKLAILDCEKEDVLCHAWAASPPQVVHILQPQPFDRDRSKVEGDAWTVNGLSFFVDDTSLRYKVEPDQSTSTTAHFTPLNTTVRYISLNRTSVTAPEIAAIHVQDKYKETSPYEGFFHPFDGLLAKNGLSIPLGYVIGGFSKIPSWAIMLGMSFLSRTFMNRNLRQAGRGGTAAGAQPSAAR